MTPYRHLDPSKRRSLMAVTVVCACVGILLLFSLLKAASVTGATRLGSAPRTVAVVLALADPPLTQLYANLQQQAATAASAAKVTQAQLTQIDTAQTALLPAVTALGGELLFRNQRVYNGIALRIDEARLPQLAQLPGVVAVHRITPKQPSAHSTPLVGAPSSWQGRNGISATGAGVTIAIIDTGVDYLHTAFGGPGGGYDGNAPTIVGDVQGFPSSKIIGGYDFVGDDYNADPNHAGFNPIPNPDPDPMDCYPHGTGVAAIAAGYGVNADGSTYTGPYDQAVDLAALRIAPGVAPHAHIYALKVFGCRGSSEIVDQAIEWAVDPNGDGDLSDRVDVINLSLGSPYGALDDITTLAAENAAAAGVVVVASAGNSGDTTYVVGSPSVGGQIISVAAGDTGAASFSARGPRRADGALKPDLAAPGVGVFTAAGGTGSGGRSSSGTSFAAPYVAGGMALLRQIYPNWTPLELKALAMNSAQPLLLGYNEAGRGAESPVRIGAGRVNLARAASATVLAVNAQAPELVSLSFGAPEVQGLASLQRNLRIFNKGAQDTRLTLTYGPVTTAPGVTVTLPMTTITIPSGGLADTTVQLVADTWNMRRVRDPALAPTQQGLPRHWLSEATGYVLIWPPPAPFTATAAFGAESNSITATFAYTPAMRQLQIQIAPTDEVSITRIAVDRQTGLGWTTAYTVYSRTIGVTVPSLSTVVELATTDAMLLAYSALSLAISAEEMPAARMLVELPAPVLNVPIYAAPRPAAAMRVAPATITAEGALTATHVITLTGTGVSGRHPPTDVVSLVSVVELHAALPRLSPTDTDRARLGFADLRYVGVGSGAPALRDGGAGEIKELVDRAMLNFAVAVYTNWSTPNQVEFDVMIDFDGDGAAERVLYHTNVARHANSRSTSDVFMTALRDLHSPFSDTLREPLNGLRADEFDSAIYNSNVLVLPVNVDALGMPAGQSDFWFWVESYSDDMPRDGDGRRQLVDRTPMLRYDIKRPTMRIAGDGPGGMTFFDAPGATLTLQLDYGQLRNTTAQGLLLLHHHNVSELRGEAVQIKVDEWSPIHLPLVSAP